MSRTVHCRLAKVPQVVAVKDATGGLASVIAVKAASDLPVLSGDDPLTLPMMAVGACGVASVVSNVWPEGVVKMVRAAQAGDFSAAREEHYRLWGLCQALFIETNPVPVKYAMQQLGMISNSSVRLPLVSLSEVHKPAVDKALRGAGLVHE
jgi:4-hydroxy-tetrahydrodipicolinate synthase